MSKRKQENEQKIAQLYIDFIEIYLDCIKYGIISKSTYYRKRKLILDMLKELDNE